MTVTRPGAGRAAAAGSLAAGPQPSELRIHDSDSARPMIRVRVGGSHTDDHDPTDTVAAESRSESARRMTSRLGLPAPGLNLGSQPPRRRRVTP